MAEPYYRRDLALVHHLGFGFHADACAPGILALLEPMREQGGLVLELGCGSGLLTKHLTAAGHRVLATDASEAMLELARETAPEAEGIHRLVLPDDPVPACDALVSVGHVLNYLPDEAAIERGLVAIAGALRPAGLLAIDLCDVRYGEARRDDASTGRVGEDWAIVGRIDVPDATRFVREITTFLRSADGTWRRDDERHVNVLLDTAKLPHLLGAHGVEAEVGASFGEEALPDGLVTIIGRKNG